MGKLSIFNRQRFTACLFYLFCIFLIMLISGCGGGSDGSFSSGPSETGSASFTVAWHDAPVIQASENTLIPTAIDCGATGVSTVTCEVYEVDGGSRTHLTSGGPWDCSEGTGRINTITAGTGRAFVVLGEGAGGILYQGETTGITITAGQTTNVGVIDAYPFVPTGLTATSVSSSQINLSWNAPTGNAGVIGYRVYRDGVEIGTSASTSYSDTDLESSTQYCYTVSAYDAGGNESGQSSQDCATTVSSDDIEAPTIPTGLSATAVSSSQIDLSWNASTDDVAVAGYNVYRDGSFLKKVTSTSTSDTGLSADTQYCYTVTAYDSGGNESGQSSQNCATTVSSDDIEAPTIPTGLSATAVSSSQIDLSWNASTDDVAVAGYNVYRDGSFLKSVTSTSTSDTGLSADTEYCYTVTAYDAGGNESGQSSQNCAPTGTPSDPPTPDPMTWATEPYATSTAMGTPSISMVATTASDPSTPITYTFDFVDSPTGGSGGSDSAWQSSTTYSDSVLGTNQQYGYRVRARDGEGNTTGYSSTSYAYTLANRPGYPSGGPFSNITENSIRVSWGTNGNPPGTEYFCDNMDNESNSGWTTNTYWNSTGLICDTSYEFRVKARNGDGGETDWRYLDNQYTLKCTDILITIGDNDGYGYGATTVPDNSALPPCTTQPGCIDPERNWIFDNRETSESSATDGSQYTDSELYQLGYPNANFTITFTPVDPSTFLEAQFTLDVSGIQTELWGASSLSLDGNDYSSYLPQEQETFGSNVVYIFITDSSLFTDGSLTVHYQGGSLDSTAIDFFKLEVFRQ